MNQSRAELFDLLNQLLDAWPTMRMGQLVSSLAVVARGIEASAVWEMEDEELLAAARSQLAEVEGKRMIAS